MTLALVACSDRASVSARATVQMFYSAMLVNNVAGIDDNLAPAATPALRERVLAIAERAQTDPAAERSVRALRVDSPSVHGNTATVHVILANGTVDDVSLVREGLRWKVITSRKFG